MSGVIYCIKDCISTNDVKQLIKSHINKMGIKILTPKLSSVLSEDQQSLKSKSLEIDKIFQDCSELLKEISHEKHFKNHEDDDVLLVFDNFHSIATKELALHTKVYVHKCRDDWHEGVISEITNSCNAIAERTYWVRFGKGRSFPFTSKKIAFSDIPSDKLSVGTRVIGLHRGGGNNAWHLGVVSEPPNWKNQNRYLIFFDDGYAQYNSCTDIRQVYDQNKCVWEDIIGDTAFVIRDYIQQYPNRSMVRLKPGHSIKINFKGDWVSATVLEVDASLVKMMHVGSKVEEWIYRGSRRLEPLYNELSKAEASQKLGRAPRFRTEPKLQKKGAYVVYIMQSDENDPNKDVELIDLDPKLSPGVKRPVARKSCHNQNAIANHSETQIPQKQEPDGVLQSIDRSRIPQSNSALKKNKKTCVKCTPKCVMEGGDDPSKFRGSNPLLIPMLYGWERKLTKAYGRKRTVSYTAFCGKVLKNIDDLDQCLMTSNSQLTIDLFSFDINLNTDHEFVVKKNFCDIKDFSLGKEKIPIPCINSVDRRFPEYIEYSTHRIPGEGVNLNTIPEFLAGCNCTDNCRDRTKCQCIRLTVDATDCIPNGRNPKAGYAHRRLKQPIVTGLYECNSNCSCDHRCQNRVIQNGLNLRLQIFKTEQKGWGLRSMDDIPAGGFICVYSGQILTEESANEDGQLYGDEYLADLDHIDVVEKEKEGYESDVRMDDDDNDSDSDDDHHDDDDDDEDKNGEEDDDDDLKWLKHYHYKSVSVEKKPMVKRISKKTSQSKPVARKFTSKKTSSQSWSAKSKVKESKQLKNEQRCEGRGGNESTKLDSISLKERNDKGSNSGESSTSGERTKIKEERSSNGRSEVDDDMEIEIDDDDEILETNDIEQPSSSTNEQNNPDWEGLKVGKVENMEVNETIEKISDKLSVCLNKKMQNVEMMTNIQKCVYDSNRVENTYLQRKDKTIPRKSTRQLYGEDTVYIIDAKSIGNIGRYFNHSCSPNIFVQNVFYDTHDLRFPWVAFFASKLIKAGTELTWNYNYEVGSVPGKKLACHCGSANCNGRLL